jgi:hypothetical protein
MRAELDRVSAKCAKLEGKRTQVPALPCLVSS